MATKQQLAEVFPVTSHTDYIGPGSTFVAIRGLTDDGVRYIEQAITRGAQTIVIEQMVVLPQPDSVYQARGVQIIRVENTRRALAELSAQAAGYPARKLHIIGVTGTKGKTTTVFLLEHILKVAGFKTALLSGVKNSIIDHDFSTELTTQQPDYLHQFLQRCVTQQVDYVVMEVAAQALSLHRVAGIEFDHVIFTNFSNEHAEFYSNLDDYFHAKSLIVQQLKPDGCLLINGDDEWIAQNKVFFNTINPVTFGFNNSAVDYHGIIKATNPELQVVCSVDQQDVILMSNQLMGTFNAYNCLGVFSMAHHLGILPQIIVHALQTFTRVPGRLEQYRLSNDAVCIIDYAHNPSSYESILSLLRTMTDHLIVVFGAGGGRDPLKRPIMGSIVARYADIAFVTSDNPRNENPACIARDILVGMVSTHCIIIQELDRKKAIQFAYRASRQKSIIVLLGKGHEEYQKIGDIKYHFSERDIVRNL